MIRHIVAMDQKRGIAKDGVQPWKLMRDERYFSDITKTQGAVMLMGRTTFEVIGRALPGRQNVIASRDPHYRADGATVIHDVNKFLWTQPETWVIGGAQLYAATLAVTDELYITEIEADFDCDVFYPAFSDKFEIADEGELQQENGLVFRFNRYTRRP